MLLCFVDESGTPPKPQKASAHRFFVIAGIIIHENQWSEIASEARRICQSHRFRVSGEIKWRYFGAANTDRDNSVAHLNAAQRDEFRVQIFDVLTKRKSVRIVACVSDAIAAYKLPNVNDADDLYHHTYKPVSERFQYHLQDLSRTVGDKQLGIIIADHRSGDQDKALRRHHHSLLGGDAMHGSDYANFVETVFLTPSHLSVGIQLADMVAGAIGRAINSKDTKFARLLVPAFRRSPKGAIAGFGFVRFPSRHWGVPPGGG